MTDLPESFFDEYSDAKSDLLSYHLNICENYFDFLNNKREQVSSRFFNLVTILCVQIPALVWLITNCIYIFNNYDASISMSIISITGINVIEDIILLCECYIFIRFKTASIKYSELKKSFYKIIANNTDTMSIKDIKYYMNLYLITAFQNYFNNYEDAINKRSRRLTFMYSLLITSILTTCLDYGVITYLKIVTKWF